MTERLYYADAFLRTFPARVTDIREASRTDGVSVWQMALDRTAFYPTSGGQPFDTGVLTASSRSGAVLEAEVEAVEEDEQGTVWHFTRKPLTAGTQVEGSIHWQRRLDHMQQHSGQHLLSAVFARELKAPTVSFHLGETISTIDLATGALAHHSTERVEQIVNELIAEDRPVTMRIVDRAEADALLAAGQLSKLPEREGNIRLIEIAGCDLNACGGTHVRSTGQIGGLLLRGVEKVSRGVRVSFVCGLRAVSTARHDFELLNHAAGVLSIGRDAIPAAMERLKTEAKAGEKERQRLREELASYHAARLIVEEQSRNGLRLVSRCYDDHDAEYARILASRLTAAAPHTVALLVSCENWPAKMVLAAGQGIDLHCGDMVRQVLTQRGLRGGGSSGMAQADIPKEHLEAVVAELETAVREKCGSRR